MSSRKWCLESVVFIHQVVELDWLQYSWDLDYRGYLLDLSEHQQLSSARNKSFCFESHHIRALLMNIDNSLKYHVRCAQGFSHSGGRCTQIGGSDRSADNVSCDGNL